jgi:glutathionyl-hydroquinone reductase
MNFEINRLMESEIDYIKDIAWLLYDREGKGMTENEVNDLVGLLLGFNSNFDTFVQEETGKIYQEGYDTGYKDAKNRYACCCELEI